MWLTVYASASWINSARGNSDSQSMGLLAARAQLSQDLNRCYYAAQLGFSILLFLYFSAIPIIPLCG